MKLDVSSFDAVIFDLGGVILNIDYQLTVDAFKALGVPNFDEMYTQAQQSELFDLLETGKISPDAFRTGMRNFLPEGVSDAQIDTAWNALLLDLPKERLEVLRKVQSLKRTFLLSNTNAIHYQQYCADLNRVFGFSSLANFFEKDYYSFEMGQRKPDVAIFETVIREQGLVPSKTLFIDDSIQHIHGARKAGLIAHHLTGGATIVDLFSGI